MNKFSSDKTSYPKLTSIMDIYLLAIVDNKKSKAKLKHKIYEYIFMEITFVDKPSNQAR